MNCLLVVLIAFQLATLGLVIAGEFDSAIKIRTQREGMEVLGRLQYPVTGEGYVSMIEWANRVELRLGEIEKLSK